MSDWILQLKNIPGPRVKDKLVVIECDDFGGIRIPSNEVRDRLLAAGVTIDPSRYNLLDTLEDKEDLEQLFDTLYNVRDGYGRPAVVSPFVNVANPDFESIKAKGFDRYVWEPFTDTLRRYGRHEDTMKVWRQGADANIFVAQFHGREHICVQPWLQKLREGNRALLKAFDLGVVAVSQVEGLPTALQEFRPEFLFTQPSEKPFLHDSIMAGVRLFEETFGYTPAAFAPSNSVFHPEFENTVWKSGVPFVVVSHLNPTPGNSGQLDFSLYTFRRRIRQNRLNYYIRNCAFEPSERSYKSIELTIRQIAAAFRWRKPAIISTHRVNFVGGLSQANRSKGLAELQRLLRTIVKTWPDVRFVSSAEMLKELAKRS